MNQKLREAVFSRGRVLNRKGLYGAFDTVMRYITWAIAAVLIHLPITGNQVTIISVFVNLSAAAAMAGGSLRWYLLGFALLVVGEFCDWVDGTIARYRGEVTKLQSDFLGRLYHIATLGFLFAGIGFGVFQETGNGWYIVLGFLTAVFQQTTIYILELKNSVLVNYGTEFLRKKTTMDNIRRLFVDTDTKKKLLQCFSIPMDYLLIKIIILVFALTGKMAWLVVFYFWYTLARLFLFAGASYLTLKRIEAGKK